MEGDGSARAAPEPPVNKHSTRSQPEARRPVGAAWLPNVGSCPPQTWMERFLGGDVVYLGYLRMRLGLEVVAKALYLGL